MSSTTAPLDPALRDSSGSGQVAPCRSCSVFQSETAEHLLAPSQAAWAATPLHQRLGVLRAARRRMATHAQAFAEAISPALARSEADTLVAELLPLLEAMRFLERRAASLLTPRRLGAAGRPLWLAGVQAEVQRVPLGHVLVIGPANFPLFLPGAQVMQALAAGNAVTWKPGFGGERVARLVGAALRAGGLPRGVLHVTGEAVSDAEAALDSRPDKVIFTGSFQTGQKVLRTLAETVTPAVMELSGADAVLVLPSADLALVAEAVAFGLRLNGAEVCMSPRRLVATAETHKRLRPLLAATLGRVAPVTLGASTATRLQALVNEAAAGGAHLHGTVSPQAQRPLLVEGATVSMAITATDIFAPVLSLLEVPSVLHMAPLVNASPYALTAAIFGDVAEARSLGEQLRTGTLLINDLIAPTADPRVPFTGRGHSGFGATRGAEGLLEMTAPKTILVRHKGSSRHYKPVGASETLLFTGLIGLLHGGGLRSRFGALRSLVAAARSR